VHQAAAGAPLQRAQSLRLHFRPLLPVDEQRHRTHGMFTPMTRFYAAVRFVALCFMLRSPKIICYKIIVTIFTNKSNYYSARFQNYRYYVLYLAHMALGALFVMAFIMLEISNLTKSERYGNRDNASLFSLLSL
jgi:hypothetical protein